MTLNWFFLKKKTKQSHTFELHKTNIYLENKSKPKYFLKFHLALFMKVPLTSCHSSSLKTIRTLRRPSSLRRLAFTPTLISTETFASTFSRRNGVQFTTSRQFSSPFSHCLVNRTTLAH